MFFRNKNKQPADNTNTEQEFNSAPGTDIRFDPELINKLKGDHQSLLKLYGDIKAHFDSMPGTTKPY